MKGGDLSLDKLVDPIVYGTRFFGSEPPYDWQIKTLQACWKMGARVGLVTPNESGKAVPDTSVIPTPSGPRVARDLRIGDLLFARDGKPYPITGVFQQGERDIYRLDLDGTVHVDCDLDHLWVVRSPAARFGKAPEEVCSTAELLRRAGPNPKTTQRFSIPRCAPVQYNEVRHVITPYILGVLLGDGCLQPGSVTFMKPDRAIRDRVETELPEECMVSDRAAQHTYGIIATERHNNPCLDELRRLKLAGVCSESKSIPSEYLYDSVQNRIALLRGLMDTDGGMTKNNGCEFYSSSIELAHQVLWLVRSLGGAAHINGPKKKTYSHKGEKRIGKPSYTVTIRLHDICPFWLKRKAERWSKARRWTDYVIRSIRKIGREPCRCFSVASPDSTFLTECFVVTHNTSRIISDLGLTWMCKYPGGKVVSTASVYRQIEDQLWPTLRAKLGPYPAWSVIEDKITAPTRRGLPPSTWNAFSSNDPGKVEGYHGYTHPDEDGKPVYCPLLIIVDEAKSVRDDMFDPIYRCDPDVLLVVSSPGEDSGMFYRIMMGQEPGYQRFWVTWQDCPHLCTGRKKEQRERIIAARGINDPFVQSMIFGKFFRAGGYRVFESTQDIEFCMSGGVHWERGILRGSCDFSGGKVDEQVALVANGNSVVDGLYIFEQDTMRQAQRFVEFFKKHGVDPQRVNADAGGLGIPCIDAMESMGFRGMRRYNGQEPARNKVDFFNRAAEDLFWVRTLVERRAIRLPLDQKLKDEMLLRRYEMPNSDSNRVRAEAKQDLLHRNEASPNRLDALMMLFSDYQEGERTPAGADRSRTGVNLMRTDDDGPRGRAPSGFCGMLLDS